MIFSGDSIEYLEMANQLNHGQFPKSEMWMPLYPLMIWIFSKGFFVDLLLGAKLYHFLLSSLFVFGYNNAFVQKQTNQLLERIILNIPIFAFLIFLEQSITLMAEFQFLVITLFFFFWINKILNKKKTKDVYIACLIVILSILTKYNGFVNFAVLILVVMYVFPIKKTFSLIFISSAAISLIYGSWLWYKPGGDFLVGGVKVLEVNYWQTYIGIAKDYCLSFSKYFLPFRLNEWIKLNISDLLLTLTFTSVLILVSIFTLYSFVMKKMTMNKFLVTFIIIYSVLFIFRSLPLGKNETNTRTLFYVLFISTYLMSSYVIKIKSLTKKIIILILPLLGFLKVLNSVPSIFVKGIGPLANEEYTSNSNLVHTMLSVKDSLELEATQIFSNESKVLSLFFGYKKLAQLPISKDFAGNNYKENLSRFKYETQKLSETMANSTNWLVVYVKLSKTHPRYDRYLESFIGIQSTNVYKNLNIKVAPNTTLIWPKKSNLKK